MSSRTITIRTFLVVLKMPKAIGDKIIRLNDIKNKITLSSYFTGTAWTATVTLAQFGLDVAAYIQAVTNVKNHVAGAMGVRTAAWATIKIDLEQIETMVRDNAHAHLPLAEAIILSAGFFVEIVHTKQKMVNGAYNTEIEGTILLTGEGAGYHDWEQSKDKIKLGPKIQPTSTAHTLVPGFVVGDIQYFRMRKQNTSKKTYAWSAWIELKIGAGGKNAGGGVVHGLVVMPTT